ncbi:MAG: type II toxin-antitoxin system HicB family antitoxin [Alphaproteobacteria bacterium]|nr:type II toxin-antitoxin system HicB family antitoxin [Alphaproteobacteria bacterium]
MTKAVVPEDILAYPATLRRDRDGRYLVRFRDLPEAWTDGATKRDALGEASDALSEAIAARIVTGEEIPLPSLPRGQDYRVAPDATITLKAGLYKALKELNLSIADLARRLKVDHREARRLLDPRHPTKLPRLREALAAVDIGIGIVLLSQRPGRGGVWLPEVQLRQKKPALAEPGRA